MGCGCKYSTYCAMQTNRDGHVALWQQQSSHPLLPTLTEHTPVQDGMPGLAAGHARGMHVLSAVPLMPEGAWAKSPSCAECRCAIVLFWVRPPGRANLNYDCFTN